MTKTISFTAWTDESLEIAYHKKELHTFLIKNPVMQIIKPKISSGLKGPVQKPTARSSQLEAAKALLHLIKEGGIIAGLFDANDLFDTRLSTINTALMSIFDLLKPLVGEKNVTAKVATRSTDDMLRWLLALTLEDQTGKSSHYESATEEVDTDNHETKRMMDVIAPNMTQGSNAKLESYFQAAMNRFLKEQQGTSNPVISAPAEDRDVDMESVGSPDQHPNLHEYDPDKKFMRSKAMGKINNKKATLLFEVPRCPYWMPPLLIEGRTCLKITLAGSLVYFFEAWVGSPTGGQDLILGMDFMVPAGIRLDLADGAICLSNEVRIQMAGRRPLYEDKVEHVCWKDHYWIDVGQTAEIRLRGQTSNQYKAMGHQGKSMGANDHSRTRKDTLSTDQATTDEISEAGTNEQITEPMEERPEYVTPTAILPRPIKAIHNVKIAGNGDASPPSIECTSDQGTIDPANSNNLCTKVAADIGDPTMDEEVGIKEGGTLFAEDVEDQMAVLPEVTATTEEVRIEDLQIGDANINTQEEIERLVQIIWKRKHLLIERAMPYHQRRREWYVT
ncbi:Hypothetical protein PHPALM_6338 [Phytophthora palmivora]|uniref:Uncharacterized protein n=1 Tax=Phytophthora palmivora TaxID=4796 RepID=A0A2P4YF59_9STRA|nr:Hypothetical protein PHPALM_6338 [Phytophthora palmivora]